MSSFRNVDFQLERRKTEAKYQSPGKENTKSKILMTQDIQEIWDTLKRPNIIIIGIEGKNSQLKGTENMNKIKEESFTNMKRDAHKHTRAYRTAITLDQKRKSSHHIISKTKSIELKKNTKSCKVKCPGDIQRWTFQNYMQLLNRDSKS